MAKSDVERVTEEKIAKGGILVRFYFDIQDKEEDKLQPILLDLINNGLMKEKGVVYCYGSIEKPLLIKDTYVTSGIVTMLFESFMPLVGIAFRYAPAGIEILKPDKGITFNANDIQSILMDISQLSLDYSKFILERVLKPEEVEGFKKTLENRALLGKQILENKNKDKEDNAGTNNR
ncbi:MAG: hypothetical protein ACP5RI_02105 [Candidatus Micrarchaeia archaeon]